MPTIHNETDAIILDSRQHGESDVILTLFCRDFGRINVIAKGGKKSKKRFVNKLEIFSSIRALLRRSGKKGLPLLEDAELVASHIKIRENVARYTTASVVQEILLAGTRDHDPAKHLFHLTQWAFQELSMKNEHLMVLLCFFTVYLEAIGYRPELEYCLECGNKNAIQSDHLFNVFKGGILCGQCSQYVGTTIPLSQQSIILLCSIQQHPLEQLLQLNRQTSNIHEGLNILHRFGRHVLQREIVSWKMLRHVFLGTQHSPPSSS